MRNKILLSLAAVALVAGTAYSATVWAQEAQGNSVKPPTSLIDRLVEHFNLDQEEVQTVVDQAREEGKSQMQARYVEYLDQAVESGDITANQKQIILDKHDELLTEREKKRAELQDWAKASGVDLKYLFGNAFNHRHAMGMHMMRGF